MVQLQEIAVAANVTQVSIQPEDPQPPAEGGDYTVIPITMSFEGTYGELQNFLLRLQNLARLVTVNGLTYEEVEQQGEETTGGQENVENLLQIEVVAEVYAQPSGSAADPAVPVPRLLRLRRRQIPRPAEEARRMLDRLQEALVSLRENRVLPVLLVLAAVAIFAWIFSGFFLNGPDEEPISNQSAVTPSEAAQQDEETPSQAHKTPTTGLLATEVPAGTQSPGAEANAESYAAYESKDPFRPLLAEADAGDSGEEGSGGNAGSGSSTGGGGQTSGGNGSDSSRTGSGDGSRSFGNSSDNQG